MSYDTAFKIQTALARKHLDAMAKGLDANYDTILLVEHKPVFTVGTIFIYLQHFKSAQSNEAGGSPEYL